MFHMGLKNIPCMGINQGDVYIWQKYIGGRTEKFQNVDLNTSWKQSSFIGK